MISSKKITLISICLVSVAVVLLLLASVFSGTDNPGTGEIAYSDEHKIIYTEDDFYNEGYLSFPAKINLKGDYASSASRNVSIDGSTVTIMGGGTYVVSGSLTDGSIIVDSQDSAPVNIVLNSAHITSSSSPAIAVKQSKKTTISTADGTQNVLSDGTSYSSDTDGNAALYSKDDLTLNGKGSLVVNGNYSDGIKCNDTLKITEGTLTINAVDDGINVNDAIGIPGGNIIITAGGDAMKCENSDDSTKGFIALNSAKLELSCQKDGITASSNVYIADISCNITQCREGIEGAYITINSGDISIVSSDDGINAVGTSSSGFARPMPGMHKETITEEDVYLTINGGTLKINTGGDGIDSNGAVIINGGDIVVFGPENSGNSSLDFECGFVINGGTLIAAGSSGMAETPHNTSKTRSLIFTLDQKYTGDISVTDSEGKVLFEASSPKSFDWVCVSSDAIAEGEEYKLNINSAETAAVTSNATVTSYGERRFGR